MLQFHEMSSEHWWHYLLRSDEFLAHTILGLLTKKLNVRLLAFDFDLTLLAINTGGKWNDSVQNLALHFRPCFRKLLEVALTYETLNIAIVTFSVQPDLIAELLKYLYPNGNTERILIEANLKQVHPQLNPRVFRVGKQDHIAKVVKKIKDLSGLVINPEQIILFDDRILYTKIARRYGNYAFFVKSDVTLKSIEDYIDFITRKEQSKHANLTRLTDNEGESSKYFGSLQSSPIMSSGHSLVSVVRLSKY